MKQSADLSYLTYTTLVDQSRDFIELIEQWVLMMVIVQSPSYRLFKKVGKISTNHSSSEKTFAAL